MSALWSTGFGGDPTGEAHRIARFRVACEEPMQRALARAAAHLRGTGFAIDDLDPPSGWSALLTAARTINDYEGARTQRERYEKFGVRMGQRLSALIERGLALPQHEYDRARAQVSGMKAELAALFREYPAVLTPAAHGPAPAGMGSTGDPLHNAPWTALGTPAISVALPVAGAPLSAQLTAPWDRDDALLAVAASVELSLNLLR
jgi:Asp-tRNA(Asn)/Glu-tRNA(Gln) amidotransferase A subunit family amidase